MNARLARDLMESSLPPYVLPEFLHEATHFCCLLSPVGFAAALLEQEAAQDTPLGRAVAHARINLLLSLYRPWLEGLALFAEFDASPGRAKGISEPLVTLARFYLDRATLDSEDPWFALFKTLSLVRQSQGLIAKKERLLSTPWTPDGYLPGYMAAKNAAYAMSHMAGGPFDDTDFALNYMIRYLFHDWELVSLLTSPTTATQLEEIQTHALQRMEGLLIDGELLKRNAADLEMRLRGTPGVSDIEATLFSSTDSDIAVRLNEELTARADRLPQVGQELLLRRSILRLCSSDVELREVGGDRVRASVDDEDLLEFPYAASAMGQVPPQGSIDVYFDIGRTLTGLVVRGHNGQILHDMFRTPHPPDDRADLDILVIPSSAALALIDKLQLEATNAIAQFEGLAEVLARLRSHTLRQLDQRLAEIGLTWVPPDARQAFVAYLQQESLTGFLSQRDIFYLVIASATESLLGRLEEVGLDDGTNLATELPLIREKFLSFVGGAPFRLIRNDEGRTLVSCRI